MISSGRLKFSFLFRYLNSCMWLFVDGFFVSEVLTITGASCRAIVFFSPWKIKLCQLLFTRDSLCAAKRRKLS